MKVKNYTKLIEWVHAQIAQWAEDNYESAESWSTGDKDSKINKKEKAIFIQNKTQEFNDLLKEIQKGETQ